MKFLKTHSPLLTLFVAVIVAVIAAASFYRGAGAGPDGEQAEVEGAEQEVHMSASCGALLSSKIITGVSIPITTTSSTTFTDFMPGGHAASASVSVPANQIDCIVATFSSVVY